MEQFDPLIVLIFHLCLHALILDVLQSVHLILVGIWLSSHVPRRLIQLFGYHFVLLGLLASRDELHVGLVEDHFLDVTGVGLTHEEVLRGAFFIVLDNFVPKAQELQYLVEHVGLHRPFLIESLWHLSCCLLRVNFDIFGSIPELV